MPQTHKLCLDKPDIEGTLTLWDWGYGYMPVLTGAFPDGYPIWLRLSCRGAQGLRRAFQARGRFESYPYSFIIDIPPEALWVNCDAYFDGDVSVKRHSLWIPLHILQPFATRLRVIRMGEN